MHVLVTGGAGFMGSNFVRYMLRTRPEIRITNLDKLTYAGNLANLTEVASDPRYAFVKGDIADAALVDATLTKAAASQDPFDAIINYAAETHVDRSILEPRAFLETDVLGTFTLLEAVRKHGIAKYVQVSTDEVFGTTKDEFKETDPFEPNSPYSASKAGGDLLCRAYHVTYKTPVVVTHSCNVYGPNQYPEKVIPLFVTNLAEGKKVPLYGNGQQVREWIYVTDHCRAIEAVLDRGVAGQVYNIGTRERLTNYTLTQLILKHCGTDESMIEHVADRPGHDVRYAINPDKIMSELGWKPETKFEAGLAETVRWYQSHPEWWKPLKSGEYKAYYKKQYATLSA